MEPIEDRFEFWCEPNSWALPLAIGINGHFHHLQIQIGPIGFCWNKLRN